MSAGFSIISIIVLIIGAVIVVGLIGLIIGLIIYFSKKNRTPKN
jgi:hypothetical protein